MYKAKECFPESDVLRLSTSILSFCYAMNVWRGTPGHWTNPSTMLVGCNRCRSHERQDSTSPTKSRILSQPIEIFKHHKYRQIPFHLAPRILLELQILLSFVRNLRFAFDVRYEKEKLKIFQGR